MHRLRYLRFLSCFFFNDTATTEIYTFPYTTLFRSAIRSLRSVFDMLPGDRPHEPKEKADRKSTRLNSSHVAISDAVFRLKKKSQAVPGTQLRRLGAYVVLVAVLHYRP